MTEKKRDTSKKRESILDAAASVFVDEGYDNASMDRIAEVAGASKRTVYNHFSSKEVLFEAVLNRFLCEAFELKKITYTSNETLEAQLTKFADAKIEISKNPAWLGLMKVTTGVFIRNPELAQDIMGRSNGEEDSLETWLRAAKADGRIKVEKPAIAAAGFWAMIGGAFFWPALFLAPMKKNEVDEMKRELISLFMAKYQVQD